MENQEQLYTSTEVANHYRVKEVTVRRWIRRGWITAIDLGCGGRPGPYVFRDKDLQEFEQRRQAVRNADLIENIPIT